MPPATGAPFRMRLGGIGMSFTKVGAIFITCQEKIPRPKAEKSENGPRYLSAERGIPESSGEWQHAGWYLLSAVGCFICERSPARPNYGAVVATKKQKTGRSSGSDTFLRQDHPWLIRGRQFRF